MGKELLKELQYLKDRIENSDYLPCKNKKKCKIKACSLMKSNRDGLGNANIISFYTPSPSSFPTY
jgi:hypothetical protein